MLDFIKAIITKTCKWCAEDLCRTCGKCATEDCDYYGCTCDDD